MLVAICGCKTHFSFLCIVGCFVQKCGDNNKHKVFVLSMTIKLLTQFVLADRDRHLDQFNSHG